jgi:hypothetical protein
MAGKILNFTCPEFNFSTINSNSVLISSVDCDLTVSDEFHTSLGDLSVVDILSIIHHFNQIKFDSTGFKKTHPLFNETKNLMSYLNSIMSGVEHIGSVEKAFIDNQSIVEPLSDPTLWIFGCSHSYGVGLDSEEQRYGNILAEALGMPLKMIAKPGGSMNYSLRHIVNSSFKPNDLIIWQFINPNRLSYFNGKHVEEIVLSNTKNRTIIDFHTDPQIYFNHFTYINIGVRYLRAMSCNFILTSLDHHSSYNYLSEYKNYPEYVYFPNFAVDLGNDHLHFGHLSHKNLALSLLNHIHYINGKLI